MDETYYTIAQLVDEFLSKDLHTQLDENQRAALIWNTANGDIERKHTTGVYLKTGKKGKDPILGVYVDTPPRVVDFNANKEIYLIRLENQGLMLSDIDFKVSKYPKKQTAQTTPQLKEKQTGEDLPELKAEEEMLIQQLVEGLPEKLKKTAFETVSLSFRREKLQKLPKTKTES